MSPLHMTPGILTSFFTAFHCQTAVNQKVSPSARVMTESPPNLSRHSKAVGTQNCITIPPQLGFHKNNIATTGCATPFSYALSIMLPCAFLYQLHLVSSFHFTPITLHRIITITLLSAHSLPLLIMHSIILSLSLLTVAHPSFFYSALMNNYQESEPHTWYFNEKLRTI
jgi:hypothetical protein